jgi:hypothetical protein
MLSAVMLSAIMLSVIMPSVVMLSAVSPKKVYNIVSAVFFFFLTFPFVSSIYLRSFKRIFLSSLFLFVPTSQTSNLILQFCLNETKPIYFK